MKNHKKTVLESGHTWDILWSSKIHFLGGWVMCGWVGGGSNLILQPTLALSCQMEPSLARLCFANAVTL